VTNATDEKLDRIVESLGQVNVNLESVRVSISSLIQVADDHEKRLRVIERWQNHLTPILAVITFMLGATFTVALERFIS